MAKQKNNSQDLIQNLEGKLHKHFYFRNPYEFLIFMAWALFTSAVLLSIMQ